MMAEERKIHDGLYRIHAHKQILPSGISPCVFTDPLTGKNDLTGRSIDSIVLGNTLQELLSGLFKGSTVTQVKLAWQAVDIWVSKSPDDSDPPHDIQVAKILVSAI